MAFNKTVEKVRVHLQMTRDQESKEHNDVIGNARVVEYLLDHLNIGGVGQFFQFLNKLEHKSLV